MGWLKREFSASQATWKVIASDMPIGLIVWCRWMDQKGTEAISNGGSGPAKARALLIADLLRFTKTESVANTVWFTADVHYSAAHFLPLKFPIKIVR